MGQAPRLGIHAHVFGNEVVRPPNVHRRSKAFQTADRGGIQKLNDLDKVDEAFRNAFGILVAAYLSKSGTSPKALSEIIKPRVGQGNPEVS